jgi:hypothetical protein
VFHVALNSQRVLTSVDLVAEAGYQVLTSWLTSPPFSFP